MVAREITITFADLLRLPLIEDYITLCCVSNPVAGPYIGNAQVAGSEPGQLAPFGRDPVRSRASCCAPRSDGFTSGTPVQTVMDGRDALLAVAMNGTPLPVAHGFPARMVVPGLYGYVSACKWVTDINVTTFAAAQAYWVPRGWSQQAPIKTESRIDVPNGSATLTRGPHPGRRRGLGAAQGHRRGGGARRPRAVAPGPAGGGAGHRHLAAVGVGLGRHGRAPTSSRPAPPTPPATPRPRSRRRPSPTAPRATRWSASPCQ